MQRKVCTICGLTNIGKMPIDDHHLLTRKAYPQYKDELFNIVTLCRRHHQDAHNLGLGRFIHKYKLENMMKNRGFEYNVIKGSWYVPTDHPRYKK